MFCIYKTDPDWINILRGISPDTQVNFWRRGKRALHLPIGSWLYFNERRTRKIVGRGVLVGYEVLTIKAAWEKFGVGNGVTDLPHLKFKAASILGVSGENAEIGCILLSELQFLQPEKEIVVNQDDYPLQVVGPKYFEDNQLPELSAKFSASTLSLSGREGKPDDKTYFEGDPTFSYRVGYERNPDARQACLKHYGYTCIACNTNMQEVYGDIARNLIHVHHISQLSQAGGSREVDPIIDLVPLCPNCHAVAHRRVPPFSVDDIKLFIADAAKT